MVSIQNRIDSIGRFFLRGIVMLALVFYCKSCAAYFSKMEAEFKCPICRLLDAVNGSPLNNFQLIRLVIDNTDYSIELSNEIEDWINVATIEVGIELGPNPKIVVDDDWPLNNLRFLNSLCKKFYLLFHSLKIYT